MKEKRIALVLFLWIGGLWADWGSIGGQIASDAESVGGFLKQMGLAMAGVVPEEYRYKLQVFNNANISMTVAIHKVINVMGARFGKGGGDGVTMVPGGNSGVMDEHLYFSIEISGGGSSFNDPHYTLGIKNDPTVYFYHCYNDKDKGASAAEILGAGYAPTSDGFTGRIQNKDSKTQSVTYTIQSTTDPKDKRTFSITDIDPASFNFLSIPQGFSIRPSKLTFFSGSSKPVDVLIPATGIAQVTDPKTKAATAVCVNYVVNGTNAFETGMSPGNFDQPQTVDELRDISPLECLVYNQSPATASPIGQLLAQPLPWQSTWMVYEEYGWSQAQQAVIQTPIWQIPAGASTSCFIIRPSIARMKSKGPARIFIVRLGISEKPSAKDAQNAQQFLRKLLAGKLYIKALATGPTGTLIMQANAASIKMPTGLPVAGQTMFDPKGDFVAYPPLDQTLLGSKLQLNTLSVERKVQLLNTDLFDDIGVLEDPATGVKGVILVSDVFTPYGTGASSSSYYLLSPAYVDIGQLVGSLANYAVLCNYQGINASILNTLVQTFLPQTIQSWVSGYLRTPLDVQESIASFLVLLGSGDTKKLTQAFGSSKDFYVDSRAEAKLSPQGNALLKMLLYGPCSISQLPVYHKIGSAFMTEQPGWPTVTVRL